MNTTKKAPWRDGAAPRGAGRYCASVPIVRHSARAVKNNSTPIYVNGRVVGRVEDGVFRKRLRASVHFLKRPPAIAFDVDSLYDAQDAGATRVEVTDAETGRVYVARIADILRDGRRFNRGFGDQVYYLLTRWRAPDAPEQMALFDALQMGEARARLAAGPGLPRGESLLSREKEVAS